MEGHGFLPSLCDVRLLPGAPAAAASFHPAAFPVRSHGDRQTHFLCSRVDHVRLPSLFEYTDCPILYYFQNSSNFVPQSPLNVFSC